MKFGTDPSNYERLGDDNMFGDNVSDGATQNILDKDVCLVGNSESFMKSHGYEKAENVTISEAEYVSGGPMGNGEKIKTSVYDFDVKSVSKITYAKPENLNRKNMLDIRSGASKYSSSKRVLYDLIKPYGQDNKQTAYFNANRDPLGKYVGQAVGTLNRIVRLLITALKK